MVRDFDDGTSGDEMFLPSPILLDLDPDVNLHVAVSLEYAQASLGSTCQSMDPIAPTEWVCLGCYAAGTAVPVQQHAQSRLARGLLEHHSILPDRDADRSVQLVMTHMVSWQHLDAFKTLLRDATAEVQTVYGGYTRVHMNESTAARNANNHALCAVVVHIDRVQNLISWLCCGRNAQIKLGCPALCVQKSAFSVVLAPFAPPTLPPLRPKPTPAAATSVCCDDLLLEECTDDHSWVEFDKLNKQPPELDMPSTTKRTQSPTAVDFLDELWTSSDDYDDLPPLPSVLSLMPPPSLPNDVILRLAPLHSIDDISMDDICGRQHDVEDLATFVDDHGCPQEFKTLYSRNNKKGGIRNLRCFPNCKRGHHSTTSFCGTSLKVQFHRHHPIAAALPNPHATIIAFARFRNFVEPCDEFSAGMVVPQADIYRALRSKDNPKATWLQTKCVSPMLFEIRPSGRSLSWHYGFHGATLHKTMTHCIEVVFFTYDGGPAAPFQCVGAVQSPRFRVVSSRAREA